MACGTAKVSGRDTAKIQQADAVESNAPTSRRRALKSTLNTVRFAKKNNHQDAVRCPARRVHSQPNATPSAHDGERPGHRNWRAHSHNLRASRTAYAAANAVTMKISCRPRAAPRERLAAQAAAANFAPIPSPRRRQRGRQTQPGVSVDHVRPHASRPALHAEANPPAATPIVPRRASHAAGSRAVGQYGATAGGRRGGPRPRRSAPRPRWLVTRRSEPCPASA
jgi:hypothetical protein